MESLQHPNRQVHNKRQNSVKESVNVL
uniref:Uncharacterized protein n=1 Tax=Arundo donax TaxID=35708 RepID=A0A0A9SJ86_ARUDO